MVSEVAVLGHFGSIDSRPIVRQSTMAHLMVHRRQQERGRFWEKNPTPDNPFSMSLLVD
jgi:hypothetical protein